VTVCGSQREKLSGAFSGRTHLMSPVMAAAAAIAGRLTDVRKLV
jgi:homoaconitase/3-isopropylmalate dehydratase large subunit